jgi:hypothetical protein
MPGEALFMDVDGDFVLAFVFNKSEYEKVATAAKKSKSGLPRGPMGTLGAKDNREIEALHALGRLKHAKLKDLKKASQKAAEYISNAISDFRGGKTSFDEMSGIFGKEMSELVEVVFGLDGYDYYGHVKDK